MFYFTIALGALAAVRTTSAQSVFAHFMVSHASLLYGSR
jgi:hypothetical protein